ncbi:MAG: hypothetical protein ACFFAN_02665 [Promethearchaeota archaeon]
MVNSQNVMYCDFCKRDVEVKREIDWPLIIVLAIIFWPVALIYYLVKRNKFPYICRVCGQTVFLKNSIGES